MPMDRPSSRSVFSYHAIQGGHFQADSTSRLPLQYFRKNKFAKFKQIAYLCGFLIALS